MIEKLLETQTPGTLVSAVGLRRRYLILLCQQEPSIVVRKCDRKRTISDIALPDNVLFTGV